MVWVFKSMTPDAVQVPAKNVCRQLKNWKKKMNSIYIFVLIDSINQSTDKKKKKKNYN